MTGDVVRARRVAEDAPPFLPGEFAYLWPAGEASLPVELWCKCPCGCGADRVLPLYREGQPKPAPAAWTIDGPLDRPTLRPSIRDVRGCGWHGFLTEGEFRPI